MDRLRQDTAAAGMHASQRRQSQPSSHGLSPSTADVLSPSWIQHCPCAAVSGAVASSQITAFGKTPVQERVECPTWNNPCPHPFKSGEVSPTMPKMQSYLARQMKEKGLPTTNGTNQNTPAKNEPLSALLRQPNPARSSDKPVTLSYRLFKSQ